MNYFLFVFFVLIMWLLIVAIKMTGLSDGRIKGIRTVLFIITVIECMLFGSSLKAQNVTACTGLDLIKVVEVDSTGIFVWYAHSGKQRREYINEEKSIEQGTYFIKTEDLTIITETL